MLYFSEFSINAHARALCTAYQKSHGFKFYILIPIHVLDRLPYEVLTFVFISNFLKILMRRTGGGWEAEGLTSNGWADGRRTG